MKSDLIIILQTLLVQSRILFIASFFCIRILLDYL